MQQQLAHILILFLIISGCNNPQENKMKSESHLNTSKEIIPEHSQKPKSLEQICLDTTKLNKSEVKHRLVKRGKKNEWILSKKVIFSKENLPSVIYYYSAESKVTCDKPINYFAIDSLRIELEGSHFQTLKLPKFESSSTLDKLAKPDSKLIDLNFDGLMDFDLGLNERSGATNEIRRYFIYNPIKGVFEEGIDIANMGIDTSQNLIYNSWNGGHTGKISTRIWSKINNYTELKTVKEIKSDYNKELESYIVKTSELKNDGKYSIKIDTIKR